MYIGDEKHLTGCWNSDFVELFTCLPMIEHLYMNSSPLKVTRVEPNLYISYMTT